MTEAVSSDHIEKEVLRIIMEVVPVAGRTSKIADLDMDSLDLLDVAFEIEKTFDIEFDHECLFDGATVQDVVGSIKKSLEGP